MKVPSLNPQQEHWLVDLREMFPLIPERMREPLANYVLYGARPGDFLRALLANDLTQAVSRADEDNLAAIWGWTRVLYNALPPSSWGDRPTVRTWIDRGGLSCVAAQQEVV